MVHAKRVNPEDILGMRHGQLVVQAFLRTEPYVSDAGRFYRYDYIYLCTCDCGKTVEIKRVRLMKDLSVRSCGCIKVQNLSKQANPYWQGSGCISGAMWYAIRHNARVRNIPFEVTIEQAWTLFEQQEQRCGLTGVPIIISPRTSSAMSTSTTTASIDRIDNERGYIANNIQWVHRDINQMKGVFTTSRFLEICRAVTSQANGASSSTPDYRYAGPKPNRNWKGIGDISGYLWSRIKIKAAERNLFVGVSHQDIWEQFALQGGRCALTGWTLNPVTLKGRDRERTASLDRIDNSLGYEKGNIQWVHKDVNRMKYVFSVVDLVRWCRLVADHLTHDKTPDTQTQR